MSNESTEVTRKDRIYCLKASSDYHSELCEECRFYPNCDHTRQDDLTEMTIKDLEALEQASNGARKTAHWIFCCGIKGKNNVEKCSNCTSHWKKAVIYSRDTQKYLRTRFMYCPNCGAEMSEPLA